MSKLLILGGTAEARALAHVVLERHPELQVISSLAGATDKPRGIPGDVRRGGFGGTDGLAGYIRDEGVDLLVDATHPFAGRITQNAVEACTATGTPSLTSSRHGVSASPLLIAISCSAKSRPPSVGRASISAVRRAS